MTIEEQLTALQSDVALAKAKIEEMGGTNSTAFTSSLATDIESIPKGAPVKPFSRVLGENSAETIIEISETDIAANSLSTTEVANKYGWGIGDTIEIAVNGVGIMHRLVDVNHYQLAVPTADRNKCGLVFEAVDCLYGLEFGVFADYWSTSGARASMNDSVKDMYPTNWANGMKKVRILQGKVPTETEDYLFLPCTHEVHPNGSGGESTGSWYVSSKEWSATFGLAYYDTHDDNASRIKHNGAVGSAKQYLLRSVRVNSPYKTTCIGTSGSYVVDATGSWGIAPLFCI